MPDRVGPRAFLTQQCIHYPNKIINSNADAATLSRAPITRILSDFQSNVTSLTKKYTKNFTIPNLFVECKTVTELEPL